MQRWIIINDLTGVTVLQSCTADVEPVEGELYVPDGCTAYPVDRVGAPHEDYDPVACEWIDIPDRLNPEMIRSIDTAATARMNQLLTTGSAKSQMYRERGIEAERFALTGDAPEITALTAGQLQAEFPNLSSMAAVWEPEATEAPDLRAAIGRMAAKVTAAIENTMPIMREIDARAVKAKEDLRAATSCGAKHAIVNAYLAWLNPPPD